MASKPPFLTGLEDFDRVVLQPFRDKRHPRAEDFIQARSNYQKRRTGEAQDHVFVYKDKEGGIEPGCLVFEGTDAFHEKMRELLKEKLIKARDAIKKGLAVDEDILQFQLALTAEVLDVKSIDLYIENLDKIKPQNNFIFKKFFGSGKYPECEKQLMKSYIAWRKTLPLAEQPDMTFLKGDFSNGSYLVSVGAERTKVTSTVQKVKKLFSSIHTKAGDVAEDVVAYFYNKVKLGFKKTKNLDFTKETLINNLALSYGMQGQIASIKPGLYKDGDPMLLNAQTWAKGFSTFESRLKGGSTKSGSCIAKPLDPAMRELVRQTPALRNIQLQSDNTIRGVPQSLAFFLHAGDYDMLGTKGGNKGIVNNELYAIDFGHSLEEHGLFFGDNDILADARGKPNLRDDFRFKQPSKTIKHIDALYDHPLSEMMQGVYFMMRQNNLPIPPSVLSWYQEKAEQQKHTAEGQAAAEFLAKLEKIEPGSALKLFDAYIEKFTEAATYLPAYKGYADEVKAMKKKYMARTEQFLKVFNKRMLLNPDELTLLENMEKLLCEPQYITNTSADGTVLLNHLRVHVDHRVSCQMVKLPGGIELQIDVKEKKSYAHLEQVLQKFTKGLSDNLSFEYNPKTKQLLVFCPNKNIKDLMKAFHENNVAEYHKKPTGTFLQPMLAAMRTPEPEIQAQLDRHQKMVNALKAKEPAKQPEPKKVAPAPFVKEAIPDKKPEAPVGVNVTSQKAPPPIPPRPAIKSGVKPRIPEKPKIAGAKNVAASKVTATSAQFGQNVGNGPQIAASGHAAEHAKPAKPLATKKVAAPEQAPPLSVPAVATPSQSQVPATEPVNVRDRIAALNRAAKAQALDELERQKFLTPEPKGKNKNTTPAFRLPSGAPVQPRPPKTVKPGQTPLAPPKNR